jgi:hypothetical protein
LYGERSPHPFEDQQGLSPRVALLSVHAKKLFLNRQKMRLRIWRNALDFSALAARRNVSRARQIMCD